MKNINLPSPSSVNNREKLCEEFDVRLKFTSFIKSLFQNQPTIVARLLGVYYILYYVKQRWDCLETTYVGKEMGNYGENFVFIFLCIK